MLTSNHTISRTAIASSSCSESVCQGDGSGVGVRQDKGPLEPRGGRGAAAAGGASRRAELDGDRAGHPGPVGQVVPAAVVQPAVAAGGAAALHPRGGRRDPGGARAARQPVGRHRAPAPRPHRQRREEPLELVAQAEALHRRRRGTRTRSPRSPSRCRGWTRRRRGSTTTAPGATSRSSPPRAPRRRRPPPPPPRTRSAASWWRRCRR